MYKVVQRRPPVPVNIRGCENLLDENKLINLATWNVRTLYNSDDDDDFKLKALTEEMKRLKIDILGLSETHWINEIEEAFKMNDYVIVQSGRKDNIHRQGVAIFITNELSQHMCGYALVNERIMYIQLNTKTGPLFLFQVYTPDSSYNDDTKEDFFQLLQQQINALPRNSRFVVLGDFNGKVGRHTDELWTGRNLWCLWSRSNERRRREATELLCSQQIVNHEYYV